MIKALFQHRVARNAGALVLVQLANYVAPFLVLIHLTRILGLDLYGVIAFSLGIIQFSNVVLDVGFSLSATQKISVWRHKPGYVARFIGGIFFIKSVLFLLLACGIGTFAILSEKYSAYSALLFLGLIPILGQAFQPTWFFSGMEKMRYITIFMVGSKIVFVVFIFLLVKQQSDYLWVPVANGVAQISAMAVGIYLIYHVGYRISLPSRRDVRYALNVTRGFFVSRVCVVVYTGGGVVLLGLFSTPSAVAIYSLAEQLYRVMQNVFAPINQAIYPYMAKEKNFPLFRKLATVCVALAAFGAVCGYFAAPYLIPLVFGPGWDESGGVFNLFLVAIIVNVMAIMSGYPLAAAIGKVKVANSSVIYGSWVYVLCVALLVLFSAVTPIMFAAILIVAELYVFVHRAFVLWPLAYRLDNAKARILPRQ